MSGGFFMRKIIIPLFLMILLVIGCDNTMNTPTVKVEKFLAEGGQGGVYIADYNGQRKALKWYKKGSLESLG